MPIPPSSYLNTDHKLWFILQGEVYTLQFRFDGQYPISSPAVQFVVTDGHQAPIHPVRIKSIAFSFQYIYSFSFYFFFLPGVLIACLFEWSCKLDFSRLFRIGHLSLILPERYARRSWVMSGRLSLASLLFVSLCRVCSHHVRYGCGFTKVFVIMLMNSLNRRKSGESKTKA